MQCPRCPEKHVLEILPPLMSSVDSSNSSKNTPMTDWISSKSLIPVQFTCPEGRKIMQVTGLPVVLYLNLQIIRDFAFRKSKLKIFLPFLFLKQDLKKPSLFSGVKILKEYTIFLMAILCPFDDVSLLPIVQRLVEKRRCKLYLRKIYVCMHYLQNLHINRQ